jgi:O-antigen ligase
MTGATPWGRSRRRSDTESRPTWVFFALARDQATLRLFLLSLGAGFLAIAVAAIAGYVTKGYWPLGAWYGETPLISHYLLLAVPGALLGLFAASGRWFKALLPPAALLVAALVILTGQRATWFAIGVQLLVAGACYWRTTDGLRRWRLPAGAIVIAIGMLVGLGVTESVRTTSEPMAAMERDQRLQVWGNITGRIAEHPLAGAGFGREVMKRAYPDLIPGDNPLFWHAHNIVLNYGLSAGIPGMVAILALFLALGGRFWAIGRSDDPMVRAAATTGCVIVAGVLARNVFNDFFIRDGAMLFWRLCGSLFGFCLRRSVRARPPQPKECCA